MSNSLMDAVRGMVGRKEPSDNPNVVQALRSRKAYNDYVIACQSNGDTPLPFTQWAKGK